ncbi:hypothetical protein HYPSUDRAFT_713336 [Hypholoma sublateritium FD-334 SS-4]|uniref:Uncharacterized protein n=1 Tax=Hypholoma sublateritium (strain FD-334 SS-4) TaxID=945553 RepID=A0A0D2LL30_HYPSF|nr:hypothetical protein HYPSUDRAFT_713336 [Hypholoma sublateritium FD-334 SS-4]
MALLTSAFTSNISRTSNHTNSSHTQPNTPPFHNMKIPASSSIFLATLAISSSSSCLAAPAGDPSQMTTSASSNHISSIPSPSGSASHAGERIEEGSDNFNGRVGQIDSSHEVTRIVRELPVVGPMLAAVMRDPGNTRSLSSRDLSALQASAEEVRRALGTLVSLPGAPIARRAPGDVPIPIPVAAAGSAMAGALPVPVPAPVASLVNGALTTINGLVGELDIGGDPSFGDSSVSSSSADPTQTTEDNSSAASSTDYSSASASAAAPQAPPNTPAIPASPVKLPVRSV